MVTKIVTLFENTFNVEAKTVGLKEILGVRASAL
jgi:hypothetical protein